MNAWVVTITLLALFGIFREIRPSESFLTQYLEGPWKNLTLDEVNNEIYPVWTYSYVVLLFVVLFITDFLRYKPVIVIEGVAYVVTWVLLLWAQGVLAMQFMEFFYGVVTATEVAYFSYIYAKVPKERYKLATAIVRAATLCGQCLSGVLAQVLVSTKVMDYHSLNYISLADVSVALIIALFLPSVPVSIYFHRKRKSPKPNEESTIYTTTYMTVGNTEIANHEQDTTEVVSQHLENERDVKIKRSDYERVPFKEVGKVIWADFKSTYTNTYQIKWCLWWVLATCSYEQVVNYIQPLWEVIYPSDEHEDIYQGAVDAVTTLAGALAALSIGFLKVDWDRWGEYTLAVVSLIEASVLLVAAQTTNIWIAYVFYGIFTATYYMLITITTFQVAKKLREDSYGLIFGCNQFLALVLQTILTVIVVDENCIGAGPRTQFLVYGSYVAATGVLFLIIAIYSMCIKNNTPEILETSQTSSSDYLVGENELDVPDMLVTDKKD